jgi:pSer/pThr/pTyr-binding forkhead associated (FHA) protein
MSDAPKKDKDESTVVGGVPVYVVSRQAKPAKLRQIKGPGAPRELELALDEIVVGRALESHVCIDSSTVSRRHALLKRSETGYVVEDLESGNGIYVNTERVSSAPLKAGDTLQIGDALFVFQS